jgi:pyruvate dehydrogenase E2 component (dihydrolipoamide acetyltransferase)
LSGVARAIVMPTMGMYTEEGVLTAWLRAAGTRVSVGEVVAEITTEKATFEIPAPEEGTLHQVAPVGTTLRVEALMGYILRDGEAAPENTNLSSTGLSTQAPRHAASPLERGIDGPLRASPVAKRMAAQHGIDLKQVKGTGPGGRIVEADLQAVIADKAGAPTSAAAKPQSPIRVAERVPMHGLRRSLAERLHHTLTTAVSTTLTRDACADVLVAARRSLSETGLATSYDALFVKIFAVALREHPELNAIVENESLVRLEEINIGFAVATPGGLLVPVVRNADLASFSAIVRTVKELNERLRSGRLQPADLEGGTATISNLGGHNIDAFTPILNGSQSVILGIGRIAERPVVRDGKLAIGHTCVLSLTFDHRVTDGAPAALLLDAVVRRMNDERFFAALAE